MIQKIIKIKLFITILVLSVLSSAEDHVDNNTLKDASNDSGNFIAEIFTKCGLGAMIFNDNDILAGVFNFTSSSTLATSSRLTTPQACQGKGFEVAEFIMNSYDELEVEIATGKGKYLDHLVNLSGKNTKLIRKNFAIAVSYENFSSLERNQKVKDLYKIVMS